jgi:hypothetical protein
MTTNFIRSLGFTIVLAIGIPALITFQGQFAKADETPTTLSADATEVQPIGDVWNRTELYFGMSKPDGKNVTTLEFYEFLDREVSSRFPDGLTLLIGYGQYRSETGYITKENSMVLILLYPDDMSNANENIEAIRNEYEKAFNQESVLRVDSLERVSF